MRSEQSRWHVDDVMGTLGESSVCGPLHEPGCVLPLSLCPCCASAWTALSTSSPDLCSSFCPESLSACLQGSLLVAVPLSAQASCSSGPSSAIPRSPSPRLFILLYFSSEHLSLPDILYTHGFICLFSVSSIQHVTCRECVSFAHGCNPGP